MFTNLDLSRKWGSMRFNEWLVEFVRTESGKDIKSFEEANQVINYGRSKPFDSYDRLFALYILDNFSEWIGGLDVQKLSKSRAYCEEFYASMSSDMLEDYESLSILAYDNYEREGISKLEAFANIVYIASKGREEVLSNSYAEGGWFGAS